MKKIILLLSLVFPVILIAQNSDNSNQVDKNWNGAENPARAVKHYAELIASGHKTDAELLKAIIAPSVREKLTGEWSVSVLAFTAYEVLPQKDGTINLNFHPSTLFPKLVRQMTFETIQENGKWYIKPPSTEPKSGYLCPYISVKDLTDQQGNPLE